MRAAAWAQLRAVAVVAVAACGTTHADRSADGGAADAAVAAFVPPGDGDDGGPAAPPGCPDLAVAADGTCAGVAPEDCGDGFAPNGTRGCAPILPAAPCPDGQVAWLGETVCHDVVPCGDGRWGTIPVEADTVYVDGSVDRSELASDGTADAPYGDIQSAVDAAPPGAIVAIAAGTYGGVAVRHGAVRLWGVCPARVEIDGTAGVAVALHASNAELHGVSVTGAQGIDVGTGSHIVVDGVRIHDVSEVGLLADDETGPADATIRRTLVERAVGTGLDVQGITATLADVVVRDTASAGPYGDGVVFAPGVTNARATVSFDGLVAERNARKGFVVATADVTGARFALRDNAGGAGDVIAGSVVTLTRVVSDADHGNAFVVRSSTATFDSCTVHAPVAGSSGIALGFDVEAYDPGVRGALTVHASTVDGAVGSALNVEGSDATFDGVLVRQIRPMSAGLAEALQVLPVTSQEFRETSRVDVRSSRFSDAVYAAVFVLSGTANLTGSWIDGVLARGGAVGDAVAYDGADGEVDGCIFGRAARVGLSTFGGSVGVRGTIFRDDAIDLDVESEPDLGLPMGRFTDRGGNRCVSDGVDHACVGATSDLAPPNAPIGAGDVQTK